MNFYDTLYSAFSRHLGQLTVIPNLLCIHSVDALPAPVCQALFWGLMLDRRGPSGTWFLFWAGFPTGPLEVKGFTLFIAVPIAPSALIANKPHPISV